jgi:hypothetical protein
VARTVPRGSTLGTNALNLDRDRMTIDRQGHQRPVLDGCTNRCVPYRFLTSERFKNSNMSTGIKMSVGSYRIIARAVGH